MKYSKHVEKISLLEKNLFINECLIKYLVKNYNKILKFILKTPLSSRGTKHQSIMCELRDVV